MGWNTHIFNNSFQWDGVSNILVDICHDNGANNTDISCYSGSPSFAVSGPSDCVWARADGAGSYCGITTAPTMYTGTTRPHMQLGYSPLINFSYTVPPIANYSYDEGIDTVWLNSPYTFVNTSSGDSVHYWDISPMTGQRTCSTPGFGCYLSDSRHYRYTFTQVGYYNVKLVVGNKLGKDSIIKRVYVGIQTRKPKAEFYFEKQTMGIGQQVQAYDYSHNGPTSWQWTYSPQPVGPGDTNKFLPSAGVPTPLFSGMRIGTFDICLKVSNLVGSDSLCKPAHLSVSSGNKMCDTNASATHSSADINGYLYSNMGPVNSYDPTTMGSSCSYFINPCATALTGYIEKFNLRKGDSISFRDGGASGPLLKKIGGSNLTSGQRYVYSTSGRLYVQWHLSNNNPILGGDSGFVMKWTSTAALYPIPTAKFSSVDTIYSGQNMPFTNQSYGQGLLQYSWDVNGDSIFGDFTTPAGANYTFISEERIQRTVCLKVSNCRGQTQYCKTITILPIIQKPLVRFSVNQLKGFTTDVFRFKDQTLYGAESWSWNIGPGNVQYLEGTTSASQNPVVRLGSRDNYRISLTVTNPVGTDSLVKQNYIQIISYNSPDSENPIASGSDIGISRVRIGYTDQLTNQFITLIDTTTGLKTPVYDTIFKARTQTVYRGITYQVLMQRNNTLNPMDRKMWLDRNLDADFIDAGEQIYSETNSTNPIATGTFTIPNELDPGRFIRLRTGISEGNTTLTPDKATAGCFEDYGLEIGLDNIPPQIILKGNSLYRVEVNKPFTDPGVNATDNLEGDISQRAEKLSNLDTSRTGIYTIKYTVKDLYGNVSDTVYRTVQVEINRTGPTIVLNGPDTQYVEVYTTFTDSGATAYSNTGENMGSKLLTSGLVNTSQLGTYPITYKATDQFGYTTVKTRIVYVRDTQYPIITTRYYSSTIRHQIGTIYTDYNIDVKDNYDSRTELTLTRTGTVNSNKEGVYYLRYVACDRSSNCSPIYYVEVQVGDTIPPQISLRGSNPLYTDIYEPFNDPGINKTDNYYAENSLISLQQGSVNTNILDTFQITYIVKDGAGNTSTLKRNVITIDRKAPLIELLGSNPFEMVRFKDYIEPGIKITDNYYSDAQLQALVKISTNLGVRNDTIWADLSGRKHVRYQVTDPSGNSSQIVEREVNVAPEAVGLEEQLAAGRIGIYPNPGSGVFTISMAKDSKGSGSLNLYNALGERVHTQEFDAEQTHTHTLNATNLAQGVYLLRIDMNNTVYTQKLIIKGQ